MKVVSVCLFLVFVILQQEYAASQSANDEEMLPKGNDEVEKGISGGPKLRMNLKKAQILIYRKRRLASFRIAGLKEKFTNGTEKKSFNTDDVEEYKIVADKDDTSKYGVRAAMFEAKTTLNNGANVSLGLYMFLEDGVIIGDDKNEYNVSRGSAKININFEWPTEAEGIEFTLAMGCGKTKARKAAISKKIRGKRGKNSISQRNPKTMDICDSTRITFSPSYTKNSVETEMAETYPLTDENLSPKGESMVKLLVKGKKIVYDPVMETGDDIGVTDGGDGGTDADSASVKMQMPSVTFTLFFAMLLVFVLSKAQ